MTIGLILLTLAGLLIPVCLLTGRLAGLLTGQVKLKGVTERVMTYLSAYLPVPARQTGNAQAGLIPKNFRQYVSPQHRNVFLDDTYCQKNKYK